jgi:hypothetical protein
MIQTTHSIANTDRLAAWLERLVRPHLTPDVSSYARGRLRAWLGVEPPLSSHGRERPGLDVGQRAMDRLAELIEWGFDFCLVTYSGDGPVGVGIGPHRDASYADFEARGLHVSGEAVFRHWRDYEGLGRSRRVGNHTGDDPPTTVLTLTPGQVLAFNCKDQHAAEPGPHRWGLNFWRRKPQAAG